MNERNETLDRAIVSYFVANREAESLGRDFVLEEFIARFEENPEIASNIRRLHAEVNQRESTGGFPSRIGDFDIEAQVGRGGQGLVFRAKDNKLGRLVALKILNGSRVQAVKRLFREAQVLSSLSGLGFRDVYSHGVFAETSFIAMEWLEGHSLREHMNAWRERVTGINLALPDAPSRSLAARDKFLKVMAQALRLMAKAHGRPEPIIHRDIKPGNIFLREDGTPVIIDFGIAVAPKEATQLTYTGQLIGSLPSMAPEQLNNSPSSRGIGVDIYGFGATIYEGLTGFPIFEGEDPEELASQIRTEMPRKPSELNAQLGSFEDAVVMRCLAKEPQDRYRNLSELADDLDSLIQSKKPLAARARPIERSLRFVRQQSRPLIILGTLALLVTVGYLTRQLMSASEDQKDLRERVLSEQTDSEIERGFFALTTQNFRLAERLFSVARIAEPERVDIRVGQVMTLARLGREDEARRLIEEMPAGNGVVLKGELLSFLEGLKSQTAKGLDLPTLRERAFESGENVDLVMFVFATRCLFRKGGTTPVVQARLALDAVLSGIRWSKRKDAMLYFVMAQSAVEAGDQSRALECGAILKSSWPDSQEAWHYAALCFAKWDPHQSLEMFERMAGANNLPQPMRENHIELMTMCERGEEALVAADELLAIEGVDRASAFRVKAKVLRYLKRHLEERAALEDSLQIKPDHPDVLAWLGDSFRNVEPKEPRRAIECYRRALEVDSQRMETWIHLGSCLQDSRKYKESESCFIEARNISPKNVQAAVCLGYLFRRTGRPKQAKSLFEHLVETAGDDERTHIGLANIQIDLGDMASAAQTYRRGLIDSPSSRQIAHNAAWVFRQTQLWSEEVAARKAIENLGDSGPQHQAPLAAAFLRVGAFEEALQKLVSLRKIPGIQPAPYILEMTAYEKSGQRDLAMESRNKVLSKVPAAPNGAMCWRFLKENVGVESLQADAFVNLGNLAGDSGDPGPMRARWLKFMLGARQPAALIAACCRALSAQQDAASTRALSFRDSLRTALGILVLASIPRFGL
ncbi:MAG: protein kinase [Planctomycetota bacterium]